MPQNNVLCYAVRFPLLASSQFNRVYQFFFLFACKIPINPFSSLSVNRDALQGICEPEILFFSVMFSIYPQVTQMDGKWKMKEKKKKMKYQSYDFYVFGLFFSRLAFSFSDKASTFCGSIVNPHVRSRAMPLFSHIVLVLSVVC